VLSPPIPRICINGPRHRFVESTRRWEFEDAPLANYVNFQLTAAGHKRLAQSVSVIYFEMKTHRIHLLQFLPSSASISRPRALPPSALRAASRPGCFQEFKCIQFDFCECRYAFPVRYEAGGGIWPHTDVADNEITLTLQLEVTIRPLGCFFIRVETCCS
jgi:hypothetical protein